ncbi:Hypothetical protein NTJ_13151 [Nesidiocoris tenuis]|uniref:Uncharacterized protein n=1 Tax=Nesidiocoris tenuis TaxID=355587 RepID=A0ABN7B9P6_9HEMI|nr:Hypothetical protein NTJ_13151 [Nesidiocoris tenuis]
MDSSSAPLLLAIPLFALILLPADAYVEGSGSELSSNPLEKGASSDGVSHDGFLKNDPIENDHKRRKRIIWGLDLNDVEEGLVYPVIRYQGTFTPPYWCKHRLLTESYVYPDLKVEADHPVLISDVTNKANVYYQQVIDYCPYPKTSFQYCGFALLTRKVVQTSCRCIARSKDGPKAIWKQMIPYNNFEDMKFIHVAFVSWADYKVPYVSARFMIHEKCSQIYNMPYMYDFGMVFLKYPIPENVGGLAPVFPIADLKKQWQYILSNEVVCLYIGWGLPGTPGIDYVEYVEPAPEAFHLQHTWRSVMSYMGCADLMLHMDGYNKARRVKEFVFDDYYSFGCNEWFGRYRGAPSPGDAGSPVTCIDDIFFGLVGWIFETNENSTAKKQLAGDSLIVHTLYENSADYRKPFLEMVDHFTSKRDYNEFSDYLPVPYHKLLEEESLSEIIKLPPPSAGEKREIRAELLALLVLRIFM